MDAEEYKKKYIECKIIQLFSTIDALLARLEEHYKYLKEKAIFDQVVECDLEKMIEYDRKLEEIKQYARTLTLVEVSLELMRGNGKLDLKTLKELQTIVKPLIPEIAIDLKSLEPYAVESNSDFIKEAISLTEERMKKWGEFE